MADRISPDSVYDPVAPEDFPALLEADRYGRRTSAFDAIISATHDHYWDPLDPRYVDFEQPFDIDGEYLVRPETIPEMQTAVADRLDEGQRIRLVNESTRWSLSNILHGEQGAVSVSAGLCHTMRDPGAQEYAANQVREEARHVTAFTRYIDARWGRPYSIGGPFGDLLCDLVVTDEPFKKVVGMQLLIEGLAMGTFAYFHANTHDPVLKRLLKLVMADEASHHRAGKIWADLSLPGLAPAKRDQIETWTAECFQTLLYNLVNIRQKKEIYAQFGLDWEWVRGACREVFTEEDRRAQFKDPTNVFRVLVKTLLNAGIITERTRSIYANWVDLRELRESEGQRSIGEEIADDGVALLRDINKDRKVIGQKTPRDGRRASA